jgi:S-adenosylmethionine:tRNA ribosyltransferase-isomerase
MSPARSPRRDRDGVRLLLLDAAAGLREHLAMRDLPRLLHPGDLVVVNDAGTLPASLQGHASGAPLEARLLAERRSGSWRAALLGAGDWRQRTEDRPAPPAVAPGDALSFGGALGATVERVSRLSPRLVTLRFDRAGDALAAAIYRAGRPIQYAHLSGALELGHVQTGFAGRPWAIEMPSAGRALSWDVLEALRRRGVAIAALTHAAGISSTGDPRLDRLLPLPERYAIPADTALAVAAARARRGRVVAVGTTVVRALEASARRDGRVSPGEGLATLRIDGRHRRRAVDAILTGMHEPGTSHHALLQSFAPAPLLDRALAAAEARGYLAHEFGDAMLVVGLRASTDRDEPLAGSARFVANGRS